MRAEVVLRAGPSYRVPLVCPHCHEIVIVGGQGTYEYEKTTFKETVVFNLDNPQSYFTRTWVQYPKEIGREIPDDVPEKIGNTYEEALDNLHRRKYETSILLCGKALDLATKGMDPAWKLEQRLKKLAAEGKITAAMAGWAQEIRLDRNTAIHEDEDFTQKDADDIVTFTEAFLTYIYTLPALIDSRRQSPDED
jgi:hypothetical protein